MLLWGAGLLIGNILQKYWSQCWSSALASVGCCDIASASHKHATILHNMYGYTTNHYLLLCMSFRYMELPRPLKLMCTLPSPSMYYGRPSASNYEGMQSLHDLQSLLEAVGDMLTDLCNELTRDNHSITHAWHVNIYKALYCLMAQWTQAWLCSSTSTTWSIIHDHHEGAILIFVRYHTYVYVQFVWLGCNYSPDM